MTFELRRDGASDLGEWLGMEGGCFRQKNAVHLGPEARRCLTCVIAKERPLWLEPREQARVGPERMDRGGNAGPKGHVKSFR